MGGCRPIILILIILPRFYELVIPSSVLDILPDLAQKICRKYVLKICSKFTKQHPCRSAISIKLICNFIEITLRHGCCRADLPYIFRTTSSKNTSGGLLLMAPIIYQHISLREIYANSSPSNRFNHRQNYFSRSNIIQFMFNSKTLLSLNCR